MKKEEGKKLTSNQIINVKTLGQKDESKKKVRS